MAKRYRKGARSARSSRRYSRSAKRSTSGSRAQRVVLEIRHAVAPQGGVVATGNPEAPFAAAAAPAMPGKGKF